MILVIGALFCNDDALGSELVKVALGLPVARLPSLMIKEPLVREVLNTDVFGHVDIGKRDVAAIIFHPF